MSSITDWSVLKKTLYNFFFNSFNVQTSTCYNFIICIDFTPRHQNSILHHHFQLIVLAHCFSNNCHDNTIMKVYLRGTFGANKTTPILTIFVMDSINICNGTNFFPLLPFASIKAPGVMLTKKFGRIYLLNLMKVRWDMTQFYQF